MDDSTPTVAARVERTLGRCSALVALAAGVAWLVWRTTAGRAGIDWWLVLGWTVVELVGLVAFGALVWALWPAPRRALRLHPTPDGHGQDREAPDPVLVVVRVGDRPVESVAATVMASADLGPILLLDIAARDDVADFATAAGVQRLIGAALEPGLDPLMAAARSATCANLLLLDAGDVPVADAADRLGRHLAADVAVVQGAVAVLRVDSAGRVRPLFDLDQDGTGSGPGAVEHRFESQVLNPALGARGVAHLTGSGALVRARALDELAAGRLRAAADQEPDSVAPEAPGEVPANPHLRRRSSSSGPAAMEHARLTVELLRAGWRIVAPGGAPVVIATSVDAGGSPVHEAMDSVRGAAVATDPIVADRARAVAASAARLSLSAACSRRDGPLPMAARVSLVAWAVQPLAGIRRSLLVALVVAAVLAGSLPVAWSPAAVAAFWAPWFVLGSVSLWSLSAGTLRPGARSRAAMLCIGPSWRGVTTPTGEVTTGRHVLAGAFGFPYGTSTAAAIVALGVVLAMRGLSDRVTHTLAPMGTVETAVLLVVALWLMAAGLSALRLLTVRRLAGRATRVTTSMFGTFDDRPVLLLDISPTGAAVTGDVDAVVGDRHELEVVVPTSSGCVSAVVPVVVRNVADGSPDLGERRLGVQFLALDRHVREALIEFCLVQPLRRGLAATDGTDSPTGTDDTGFTGLDREPAAVPRRGVLRFVAALAVVGAAVSVLSPSTEAAPEPGARSSVPAGTIDR